MRIIKFYKTVAAALCMSNKALMEEVDAQKGIDVNTSKQTAYLVETDAADGAYHDYGVVYRAVDGTCTFSNLEGVKLNVVQTGRSIFTDENGKQYRIDAGMTEEQSVVLYRHFFANNKARLFVDMDGTLAEWRQAASLEEMYTKNYFLSLNVNGNVVDAVNHIIETEENIDVYILSAVLPGAFYSGPEKRKWVHQYLPKIPDERILFTPTGKNKANYIPDGVTGNDYLLDDYGVNLAQWKESGGTPIKVFNGINGTKGKYVGNYTCSWLAKEQIVEDVKRFIEH